MVPLSVTTTSTTFMDGRKQNPPLSMLHLIVLSKIRCKLLFAVCILMTVSPVYLPEFFPDNFSLHLNIFSVSIELKVNNFTPKNPTSKHSSVPYKWRTKNNSKHFD